VLQIYEVKEPIPTLEEWIKMVKNRKPRAAIVEQIIPNEPGDYIISAGRTDIGKTNLVMNLSFSIATGTPFLELKCKKVPVSYFAFEGDDKNLVSKLEKMSKHFPDTG
jgi:RecA-family ATPase